MATSASGGPLPAISSVLIASSDAFFRRQVMQDLSSERVCLEEALGGADALDKLESGRCKVLMLDRRLPDLDPEEVMAVVNTRFPEVEVVTLDSCAAPADDQCCPSKAQPSFLSSESHSFSLPGVLGSSPAMLRVIQLVRRVARRETAVLLTGETGTGKEVIARAIHTLSPRSAKPLVVVNCAAIPESLLEAELFGYTRGAFTGAVQSRLGRIHSAQGGTLFLDEIGEMPPGVQAKLLRFLESGEVQRLGSPDVFRVDVRVLAATNANLASRIAEKQFREDLYYRLAVFPIELPPLRERDGDVLTLARQFLREFCGSSARLDAAAERWISDQQWRGNVRELRHRIERAGVLWNGVGQVSLSEIRM